MNLFFTVSFYFIIFYLLIYLKYKERIFFENNAPGVKYVLVLGAGLERSGKPSDILVDRLISANVFYHNSKPKTIIVSGTRRGESYNEPKIMSEYLVSQGIPEELIILDGKGFSTLDSINNNKNLGVDEPILIISQRFHLFRALLLADFFSIQAYGLSANTLKFSLRKRIFWTIRDMLAIPHNLIKIIVPKG